MVIITDGMATELIYVIYSLFLLMIPVLNIWSFITFRKQSEWNGFSKNGKTLIGKLVSSDNGLTKLVIAGNIVMIGFSAWAVYDQYPHPREEGYILYLIFIFLTPIVSIISHLLSIKKSDPIRV